MSDVHACKKKSAGFSKKSQSRKGFFRKVFGTAELAEQKAFFDVAHAEWLNKPSSFMLVGRVSATRATSEMCLSCREMGKSSSVQQHVLASNSFSTSGGNQTAR